MQPLIPIPIPFRSFGGTSAGYGPMTCTRRARTRVMTHETRHIPHGDGTLNSHSLANDALIDGGAKDFQMIPTRFVSFHFRREKRKMRNGRTIFPSCV